jgi:hypothetical protein
MSNDRRSHKHFVSSLERLDQLQYELFRSPKLPGVVSAIHSCSLGAPILLEEAKAAGVQAAPKSKTATPACVKLRTVGQRNDAWNPIFELDRV